MDSSSSQPCNDADIAAAVWIGLGALLSILSTESHGKALQSSSLTPVWDTCMLE